MDNISLRHNIPTRYYIGSPISHKELQMMDPRFDFFPSVPLFYLVRKSRSFYRTGTGVGIVRRVPPLSPSHHSAALWSDFGDVSGRRFSALVRRGTSLFSGTRTRRSCTRELPRLWSLSSPTFVRRRVPPRYPFHGRGLSFGRQQTSINVSKREGNLIR